MWHLCFSCQRNLNHQLGFNPIYFAKNHNSCTSFDSPGVKHYARVIIQIAILISLSQHISKIKHTYRRDIFIIIYRQAFVFIRLIRFFEFILMYILYLYNSTGCFIPIFQTPFLFFLYTNCRMVELVDFVLFSFCLYGNTLMILDAVLFLLHFSIN